MTKNDYSYRIDLDFNFQSGYAMYSLIAIAVINGEDREQGLGGTSNPEMAKRWADHYDIELPEVPEGTDFGPSGKVKVDGVEFEFLEWSVDAGNPAVIVKNGKGEVRSFSIERHHIVML